MTSSLSSPDPNHGLLRICCNHLILLKWLENVNGTWHYGIFNIYSTHRDIWGLPIKYQQESKRPSKNHRPKTSRFWSLCSCAVISPHTTTFNPGSKSKPLVTIPRNSSRRVNFYTLPTNVTRQGKIKTSEVNATHEGTVYKTRCMEMWSE